MCAHTGAQQNTTLKLGWGAFFAAFGASKAAIVQRQHQQHPDSASDLHLLLLLLNLLALTDWVSVVMNTLCLKPYCSLLSWRGGAAALCQLLSLHIALASVKAVSFSLHFSQLFPTVHIVFQSSPP